MSKKLWAMLAGAILGVGGIVGTLALLHGEDNVGPTRAARLDSCPSEGTAAFEKCDGGVINMGSYCVCLTKSIDTVTDEVETVPNEKKVSMLVCDKGAGRYNVKYVLASEALDPDCLLVALSVKMPNLTMTHIPTGIEDQLCAFCYPKATAKDECPITPGSWGRCPYCALGGTEACEP